MRKIAALFISLILCFMLCSCSALENFDLKEYIKSLVGAGDDAVSRDEGYIGTLENEDFSYEVYEDHILLAEYVAELDPNTTVTVTVPNEIDEKPVTVIGELCFYYVKNVSGIILPDSITRLDGSALYHCDGLTSVVIPSGVEKIGERCFAWCQLLAEIQLPPRLQQIPDYCFNSCSSLQTVTLPSKVTSIGVRAFSYCTSLEEIVIPDGVTSIGERAFSKCDALKLLTVPSSVTSIGDNVFEGSPNVVVVTDPTSAMAEYCRENGIALFGETADESSEPEDESSEAE